MGHGPRGLMAKALVFGTKDCAFESHRVSPDRTPDLLQPEILTLTQGRNVELNFHLLRQIHHHFIDCLNDHNRTTYIFGKLVSIGGLTIMMLSSSQHQISL